MKCKKCGSDTVKNGKVKTTGKQRYYCKICERSFISEYTRKSYEHDIDERITALIKESCGTRSISRILKVAPNTVTSRIKRIASGIQKPMIVIGRDYEMDELITYVRTKEKRICIAYALDRKSGHVVDFVVGKRNKRTLRTVVNTLLLSESKQIRTDRLNLYNGLIPADIHHVKKRGNNRIERMNPNLRTHLKRLNRRTIAYSKSLLVLSAILKIYFWS